LLPVPEWPAIAPRSLGLRKWIFINIVETSPVLLSLSTSPINHNY
jgi:hypothetical protein